MVFSSSIFLFLFLPLALALGLLAPRKLRNGLLLAANLLFYAWGEMFYASVMLASIVLTYGFGLAVEANRATPSRARLWTGLGIAANLGLLLVFKYANFYVGNLNELRAHFGWTPLAWSPIHLPIGVSFFTFQAISYVVDVYRGDVKAQRNPFLLALYKSFFPQLIAGPIVRYRDIADELPQRETTLDDFAAGVSRFIIGLGKKMLIANIVAIPADLIFDPNQVPADALTAPLAWLAVICYALQIYFDFSGYSDMAIGLGRMFGFHFLENFNYPYAARSMTDFWRRWHISLSTWFRDYLYIPLGGNRGSPLRTGVNLLAVFLLCGFWHGANWTFIVWGLYHGLFLIAERLGRGRKSGGTVWSRTFGHAFFVLAMLVSWVPFRAESLGQAGTFLGAMFGLKHATAATVYSATALFTPELALALCAGIAGALPVCRTLAARMAGREATLVWLRNLALLSILALSVLKLASGTHNPFIYFRF